MKIYDGDLVFKYEIELSHPDAGTVYKSAVVVIDDTDEMDDFQAWQEMEMHAIWEKFNYGHYYHEMIAKASYEIDNTLYTTVCRYDGYEVEHLPTITKQLVEG